MLNKLIRRDEWQFIRMIGEASPLLSTLWWVFLVGRGLLPALFAVGMGLLTGAVQQQTGILGPLVFVGCLFVLVQVMSPIHLAVSQNLGNKTASLLYEKLTNTCIAPSGMGHLEDPELTNDLAMARDFDLGISGPPLYVSMDFISAGLVEIVAGLTATMLLFGYSWWAPLLLGGAWLATHWLLRESSIWRDRNTEEVRSAQRHADYAYKLAVDPPACKELRLFGLANWIVDRFRQNRRTLHDLRWEATRLRQKPVVWSLLLVLGANAVVFSAMAYDAVAGNLPLDRLVIFATAAITASMIGFGGLSWALDGASAPAGAVMRLRESMAARGELKKGSSLVPKESRKDILFRDVSFAYPTTGEVILKNLNLHIAAGTSLAIVGQNGAGKTTLAKLLCRLYDPQEGAIEVDGRDLRSIDVENWRDCVTAVFQDYMKLEVSLRQNVSPNLTADDLIIEKALKNAGASQLAPLDTILNKAYRDGIDLSGGQWQRVALARALCAVYEGASIVLLDEPTAQLDVRGEAEIFERLLEETKEITTILISHRFSTVRKADVICVLEHGKVIEMGSHDELMGMGGRYKTMFELQASRFSEAGEEHHLDVLE